MARRRRQRRSRTERLLRSRYIWIPALVVVVTEKPAVVTRTLWKTFGRDYGLIDIGIAAEQQELIFEKFYRVEDTLIHTTKGSGLGLALVKHIMDAHGGTVRVGTSDLGGALVAFSVIPVRAAGAAAASTVHPLVDAAS
mgnify:CR=1 FL=1